MFASSKDVKADLPPYLSEDKRDMNPNTDINMSLRLRLRRFVLVVVLFSTGSGCMLMG